MKEGIIKYCSRCKAVFECNTGNVEQCQCYTIQLTAKESEYLAKQYKDCLCPNCLKEIREQKNTIIITK